MKLTPTDLTIYHYHIFFGLSKTIPISEIKSAKLVDVDGWVKYRMWGFSMKHWWHWFPLDISRHKKKKFISLDVGKLVVPCITPEDPERVYEMLMGLMGGGQEMGEVKNGGGDEQETEKVEGGEEN